MYTCLNKFQTNQGNEIKIFSRKCNRIIEDGKISRSKTKINKCTIKQIKTAANNKTGTILRLNKKNVEDE